MRLIDADALIEVVDGDLLDSVAEGKCIEKIMDAPTVDAVPVKKGKWIYHEPLDVFECSVCGSQMVRNIFNYCQWCGARIDGEKKETNRGKEDVR